MKITVTQKQNCHIFWGHNAKTLYRMASYRKTQFGKWEKLMTNEFWSDYSIRLGLTKSTLRLGPTGIWDWALATWRGAWLSSGSSPLSCEDPSSRWLVDRYTLLFTFLWIRVFIDLSKFKFCNNSYIFQKNRPEMLWFLFFS